MGRSRLKWLKWRRMLRYAPLFIAFALAACAPINKQEYTSLDGKCRIAAVDIRTGSNFFVRALATPHRFIDKDGQCNLDVEDSNPSIMQSLVGPMGSLITPVVPVR